MRPGRKPVRAANRQSGVVAIELAFILPILIVIFAGMVQVVTLVSNDRKISYASNALGDLVTQTDSPILATRIDDFFAASQLILRDSSVTNRGFLLANFRSTNGAVTQVWQRRTGAVCAAPAAAVLAPLMTAGNDVVIAVVCGRYVPVLAQFMGTNIMGAATFNLRRQIALRPRQTLRLDCTGC